MERKRERRRGRPWWPVLVPLFLMAMGLSTATNRLIAEEPKGPDALPSADAATANAKSAAKAMGTVCLDDDTIYMVTLVAKDCLNLRDPANQTQLLPHQPVSLPAGEYVVDMIRLQPAFYRYCHQGSRINEATGEYVSAAAEDPVTILPDQLRKLNATTLKVSLPLHWKVYVSRQGCTFYFRHVLLDDQGCQYFYNAGKPSQLTLLKNGVQVGEGSPKYG